VWAAVAVPDRLDKETKMPKLKTKSGVKYIRQNRGTSVLAHADTAAVKRWAPYGLK
jgi:large subunit ribosomal protein L35